MGGGSFGHGAYQVSINHVLASVLSDLFTGLNEVLDQPSLGTDQYFPIITAIALGHNLVEYSSLETKEYIKIRKF